jgi:hypothetical protein
MRSRSPGAFPISPPQVGSRCGWIPRAGAIAKGLDPARSYEVIERHAPQSIRGYRTEEELRYLVGTGVSAAAIWLLRRTLDEAGFPKVKIVASSGFGPAKCRMMAAADAPIDVIGTGSYLPELWSETYATADIIAYDGVPMVKAGRASSCSGSGFMVSEREPHRSPLTAPSDFPATSHPRVTLKCEMVIARVDGRWRLFPDMSTTSLSAMRMPTRLPMHPANGLRNLSSVCAVH